MHVHRYARARERERAYTRGAACARARVRLSPLRPDLLRKHTVRRHRAALPEQKHRPRCTDVHRRDACVGCIGGPSASAGIGSRPRGGLAGHHDAPVFGAPALYRALFVARIRPKYPRSPVRGVERGISRRATLEISRSRIGRDRPFLESVYISKCRTLCSLLSTECTNGRNKGLKTINLNEKSCMLDRAVRKLFLDSSKYFFDEEKYFCC